MFARKKLRLVASASVLLGIGTFSVARQFHAKRCLGESQKVDAKESQQFVAKETQSTLSTLPAALACNAAGAPEKSSELTRSEVEDAANRSQVKKAMENENHVDNDDNGPFVDDVRLLNTFFFFF